MWILAAFLGAAFHGTTAIIVKYGIRETDSNVATAIRTGMVLFITSLAAAASGSFSALDTLTPRALLLIVLGGITASVAWLAYFAALSMGDVNKVVAMDKGISVVLTVFLAVIIFQETANLPLKLVGTALVVLGLLLTMEKPPAGADSYWSFKWLFYSALAPVLVAVTSVLLRFIGDTGVDSYLATSLRAGVAAAVIWAITLAQGKWHLIQTIDRRELKFTLLSGVTNGIYWILNFYAIRYGIVSVVAPIDKMGLLVSVTLSYFILKETFSRRTVIGVTILTLSTLAITFFT